ncbi:hypothetical protein ACFO26_02975 [Lactococcus nasutitermitis]|uniref:Uncharacterized protein n=1 Tax=Lactococcus nasutitermitis TaxID=1652957 RepID=A0ABV9JET4_9LACT|nr:hypothetical protein [Lactococcus nasutitermitis]
MEQKEKLKTTLIELNTQLKLYGSSTMYNQISILSRLIDDFNDYSIDEAKEVASSLFTPKSGLSEFNVWEDDYDKRMEINSKIDKARSELWELVKDVR